MPRRFRTFLNSRCNTRVELEHGVLPERQPVSPLTRPAIPRIPVHPRSSSRYIPRLGGALKLLIDPKRSNGLNPVDADLVLGENVVKNGDFHDFTMDDDANTVGHWIFDDVFDVENGGTGNIGQDWSGNGHTLTPSGFNPSPEAQLVSGSPVYDGGNVLQFDGVDDYWYIPAASAGDFNPGTGDFTVEFWMKVNDYTSITGERAIINKYESSGYHGYRIEFRSGANIRFAGSGNGTSWEVDGYVYTLQDNNWHHYAFVIDRTNSKVNFYLDGILTSTLTISGSTSWDTNAAGFYIAKQGWTSIYSTNMELAEIRYSNIARTEQEIKESYGLARGWVWYEGGGGGLPSDAIARNDNFAQRMDVGVDNYQGFRQSFSNLDPNTLYKLEFNAYTTGTTGIGIRLNNIYNYNVNFSLTPNMWEKKILYFKGDAGGNSSGVKRLYFIPSTEDNITYKIDNVSIRPVLNARQIPNFVEDFSQGGAVYGDNKIVNGGTSDTTDWVDSDSNGLADYWLVTGYTGNIYSIVTGNGFVGNAQRAEYSTNSTLALGQTVSIPAGKFRIKFKYRSSKSLSIQYYNGAYNTVTTLSANTGNANEVTVYAESQNDITTFRFIMYSAAAGDWFEVDEVEIRKVSNGNHGLTKNSLEANQPVHPAAWKFDGVDDYANFGDICNPELNDFILFSWIKSDKTVGATIWGKYNGGSADWMFRYTDNGAQVAKITFYWNTNQLDYYASADYSKFRFAAIVVLRSKNEVKIYIDGEEQTVTKRGTFNLSDVPSLVNSLPLALGSLYGGAATQVAEDYIGISGIYIFDGDIPYSLDIGKLIKYIYEQTKIFYED